MTQRLDSDFFRSVTSAIKEPNELDKHQAERYDIAFAVTEALERVLGPHVSDDEPRLLNPKDTRSDLVFNIIFKENLSAQIIIPFDGKIVITNRFIHAIFLGLVTYFRETLAELVEDIERVISERL